MPKKNRMDRLSDIAKDKTPPREPSISCPVPVAGCTGPGGWLRCPTCERARAEARK